MSDCKPVIVVTGPDKGGLMAWLFTSFSIRLAGGEPVRITPQQITGHCRFDGLVVGGGSDIHPQNRKVAPVADSSRPLYLKFKEALLYPMELFSRFTTGEYDKERDEMEKYLIKKALQNDKPILGICRGHQLLNAFLGGTLFTSTLPLLDGKPRIRSLFPRKKVIYVKNDSLIAKIAGNDPIKVNAIHSQAVAQPAKELEVTAREKSGVNQVIESRKNDKVLGVQWHPEYLVYMPEQRKIFSWLVQEAA